ncbi:MAG: AraC family transcriptional regulator [Ruminococcaceae bacterium]|nr:AraC family transcriptional regulator [Oscillospiraceae bacterium]
MRYYENHNLQDSKIPVIYHENRTLIKNIKFGGINWHENIEILQNTEGYGLITCDSEQIHTKLDDIVVINSNQIHSLAAESEKFSTRCLIIDRNFCVSNGFDSNFISFDHCFYDPELLELLEELSHEWKLPASAPYRTLNIRATVIQIMKILCHKHSVETTLTHNESKIKLSIKKAIDFISTSYYKDISLDDIASFVGLNKYYFAHEFHAITGLTFVSYLNEVRCSMAQRLLIANEMSIYEIAKNCGFNNKSYFAKIFKKHVGMLPNEYRQSKLNAQKKAKDHR